MNAQGMRGAVAAALRVLDIVAEAATAALFLSGALAMFAMVVTRYGFAWSDPSVEILVRYAVIWGTFVGLSAALRHGINIRFALVEHVLGGTARRVLLTAGHLVSLLLALGLAVSGEALVQETVMFGEVMPTALRFPVWPFHLSIAVGGALLALQTLRAAIETWRGEGSATEDAVGV